MPNSNFNKNILDSRELFDNLNFKITFSEYWQKVERRLKQAHITLVIILIMVFGNIIVRSLPYLNIYINDIIIFIFCLPILFIFILFILHFKKFRNRDLKEKNVITRLWLLLIITTILALLSTLVFAIITTITLLSMYILTHGFDGESMGILLLCMPFLLLSGFQAFYLGYSFLYLIKCRNLKNQYVQ